MEEWKEISSYDGYYIVSNLGRVMSTNKTVNAWNGLKLRKGKVLKQGLKRNGYLCVSLSTKNIKKTFLVHRLVASAFLENPENKADVNHKDGNKLNNVLSNLEWSTKFENHSHAKVNGLKAKGEKNAASKLTDKQRIEVLDLLNDKISYSKIAKMFNVTKQAIYWINKNK
jgi:DNA-directed RNA polymerase specialized sigma24 family protein